MNQLHLEGWGVRLRVSDIGSRSQLWCMDGRRTDDLPRMFIFRPRECPYDAIIIEGHSGYISFQALHWLSRNNIPVFIMDYSGDIISSILPPTPIKADVRAAQFQAANNPEKKFAIAKAFIQAKIARSLQVLEWLGEQHDIENELQATRQEAEALPNASDVAQIRTTEGRVALRYWETFKEAMPKSLGFQGRVTTSRNNNASDCVNLCLNYGYGFLEAECRMAVNVVGLEPAVGYLHDFANYQTKQSLVYDLQEPYRFLVDLVVFEAFTSGKLTTDDFFFQESDYRYRFFTESKGKLIQALREKFNAGIRYKGRVCKWDTVIEMKANELARYLNGSTTELDFSEPVPTLEKTDGDAVRNRILNLTSTEAKRLGIPKQTLCDLRKRAKGGFPVKVYSKVKAKIDSNSIRKDS